jgi:small subunit ribosomal protein S16
MAVVLRLKRFGRRNRPFYRICVMDGRTRRDGRVIEELGHYDPVGSGENELKYELNTERAQYWVSVGAQPSETVASLLKRQGITLVSKAERRRAKKARKAAQG